MRTPAAEVDKAPGKTSPDRFVRNAGLTLLLALCLVAARGEATAQPQTPDAVPDLQGTWTMRTLTPFFRPDGVLAPSIEKSDQQRMLDLVMVQRLAAEKLDPGTSDPDGDGLAEIDGRLRTSAVVSPANGRMALTPAGEARLRARIDNNDGPEGRPINERCIADAGRAPYRVMSGEMYFQIVQTRDFMLIHKEGMDPPRIFKLSQPQGRAQEGLWSGASVGSWQDGAFVIETTGFRADDTNRRISGPGAAGFPIAPSTHITEWLIPRSNDLILYRYRVDDPALYREPLIVELPIVRTSERLFESACHEGNVSLANTLRGGRRGAQ